jgi:integrase
MARTVGKLTALKVSRRLPPGMYADGGGLYLQVTGDAGRSWLYRYSLNGKAREMGLGPLSAVGLAEARNAAAECRRLRQGGIDPLQERKARRQRDALEAARAITFEQAAERYIASHRPAWSNAKHADQWKNTLATYAAPIIGKLSVQAIDTALVLKAIEPIWTSKPETANRVRQRIEAVLDSAKVQGFREGENPARWRGHLDHLLPDRAKVRRVKHHAALSYSETFEFITALREQEGISARALEFTILTAARTGDTSGGTWREINWPDKTWIIPADRMKARKEHRVPLSSRALAILREMQPLRHGDDAECFVFPGGKHGRPLSNTAMTEVLRRMNRGQITVHGFRSTFRDWAAEQTDFPREVAEMALAHAIGDDVEAAYRRGDLFEKRRRLMNEWEAWCGTKPRAHGEAVVPLRRGQR